MKFAITLILLLLFSLSPAFPQQEIDAASKEDVEQLFEITGVRNDAQSMFTQMTQEAASLAAESYQRKNPSATPLQIRKAAESAADFMQIIMKTFPVDEFNAAIIPIYQRHFTHSDIRAILDFYSSPAGQKVLKETPVMMAESMQAVLPIMKKHLPDLEAQAEAAAAKAARQTEPQPTEAQTPDNVPPQTARRPIIQNVQPDEMWKRVRKCVLPNYPEQALASRISGTVDIALCVFPKGDVSTRMLSGHPLLAEPALSAIRQWDFQPAAGPACSRVRALVTFNADGTTDVALDHAILADDFGDPGLPNFQREGRITDATTVRRPATAPECQLAMNR